MHIDRRGCVGRLARGAALFLLAPTTPLQALPAAGFPRLMALDYRARETLREPVREHLARFDAVVLSFWRGFGEARIRTVVQDLRRRNPRVLLGQYTVINEVPGKARPDEAHYDLVQQLDKQSWWLRNKGGERVQWTQRYQAYEADLGTDASPDEDGLRWPQWKARRDVREVFSKWPALDFVFLDNVFERPRVRAVWKRGGAEEDGRVSAVAAAQRQGYADYVTELHRHLPGLPVIANTDGDLSQRELRGVFDGAFLEGLIGRSWSIETRAGWAAAMERYLAVSRHVKDRASVVLQAAGGADDFRQMRFGLTTCLMGDGYFAFGDAEGHGPPWFDEYEVKLGAPAGAAEPVAGGPAWWRRFSRGMAIVNPGPMPAVVEVPRGWARFRGHQQPHINTGEPVRELRLPPRDGVLLVRGGA